MDAPYVFSSSDQLSNNDTHPCYSRGMDEIITENNSQFIKAEYFLPPVTQECHCLNQVAAKCQGQPCMNQPEVLSPPKPDSRNLVSSR